MRKLATTLVAALGIALVPGVAAGSAPVPGATGVPGPGWNAAWAASPHAPTEFLGPNWGVTGFDNHTVRQVVRISDGGAALRIRLSNAYGTSPLVVTGATVARTAQGAAVRPGTVRHLSFRGHRSVTVPVGGEVAGDLAPLPVAALGQVTVTLYLAGPTGPATGHAFASATSWRASGDHRADVAADAFTEAAQSWFYLAAVDVVDFVPRREVVVAFGDSITDGVGSTVDADNRYPDELAERLGGRRGVVNAGIGGNRVLNDSACFGEKATTRFGRDALGQPDVRTVILLEGINDIGFSQFPIECTSPNPEVTADQVIAGYRELIGQARARGVRMVGATLLPFKGAAYYTEAGEAVRDQVNDWIRTSGEFDAVVDFDRAMADPADPDALRPAYDSGDRLHPNDAGYRAMAEAVDLSVL
ncbi:lysophospholipase L1-like esterase [Saccharothrix saharensis]|uniref:Lysophospholipase L1-like esterase n=1 Tax=Saccharothrix saharensis TaxID=571190 RepID=A0A543J4W6_9PSEU|nr:SGNH/GDSL hydrolase family protein [Saccharothrix saharensis]TQM77873.1 lysophospholipase L1-like esterase [Saccharothrix saharensis]